MKKTSWGAALAAFSIFASTQGWCKTDKTQAKQSGERLERVQAKTPEAEQANQLIDKANLALQSKDWKSAEEGLLGLIEIQPANWEYLKTLGNCRINQGKYQEAVDSYEKGIELARAIDNPEADRSRINAGLSWMLSSQSQAYSMMKKYKEAISTLDKAAGFSPGLARAYFNLCAAAHAGGDKAAALEACDKAISADPEKADAYFIKGSCLFAKREKDKTGKYMVPQGFKESLGMYLQLAPQGSHAKEAKRMLEACGIRWGD